MTTEQDVETVRRLLAFTAEEGLTSKQTRVEAEKALSRLVKELDRPPCSLQLHDTWIARIASLEAERDRLRREVEASRYPEDFVDIELRNAELARLRRIEKAARELHIESQVQEGRVVRVKRSRYLKLRAALNEEGE